MERNGLTSRPVITAVVILQVIPLLLMPPSSFNPTSQEWWLPVMLVLFSLIAAAQIILQHGEKTWPWDLISFAQGFNIISRLLLLMPHAMVIVNGVDTFNTAYVALSIFSMLVSAFILYYFGLPAVRTNMIRE